MVIMSISIPKCILDIPDEILEDSLLTLLSFNDIINLMNIRMLDYSIAAMRSLKGNLVE